MDLFFPISMGLAAGYGLYLCIRREIHWLALLLILPGVLFVEHKLESTALQEHQRSLELDVDQQLNSITAQLAGAINNNLSLIHGLAAHIVTNPDIDQDEFSQFARAVFRQDSMLINLAAAPDMVIAMIHPLETNRKALGLDYMATPSQRDAVLRAKQARTMVVAGPVDLVQGGTAFIGRIPVFINDAGTDRFWGIVSAPIDTELLYKAGGLRNSELRIEVAMRGVDGLGEQGAVFYGDEALFADPNAITNNIKVGAGSWQLAARPQTGWMAAPMNAWGLRFMCVLLCFGALFVMRSRHLQTLSTRHYEATIRENEQLLQDAGKLAQIGGWKLHVNGELSHLSAQSARIFNFPDDGRKPTLEDILALFDDHQANQLKFLLQEAVTAGRKFDTELHIEQQYEQRWVRIIGNPVHDHGHIVEVVGAIQDITEKKKFNEMIQRQATYDSVTGLPNRFLYENRLTKAIAKAKRDETNLAILFLDLDKFKSVNDNLGHKAGDLLLNEVAQRIKGCIRSSDTVARYSGDEFTLILNDLEPDTDSVIVAEKILTEINRPYNILDHQVFCSASIGIAIYPDDGQSPEDLISNADHAMYEVKKEGRNSWHFFTREMQRQSERKHQLHNKLSSAIATDALDVYYQPIIDLDSGKISKCEALVRWFDDGQMVPTIDFITLAEETGMINEIDRQVLNKAGTFFTQMYPGLDTPICLSVNLSPRLFSARDNALTLWLDIISDLSHHISITVEITERLLTQNSDQAMHVLTRLKELGISIAIDDFGTGYSSLSYLTKFPIDILKIDRSFISNIDSDSSAETLTDTIISLAKKMSLEVVAEGIENEAQLQYLKQRGCNLGQGYYLGRPMDATQFESWIARERSETDPAIADITEQ